MDPKAKKLLSAAQRLLKGVDRAKIKESRKIWPSACPYIWFSNARLGELIAAVEAFEADERPS